MISLLVACGPTSDDGDAFALDAFVPDAALSIDAAVPDVELRFDPSVAYLETVGTECETDVDIEIENVGTVASAPIVLGISGVDAAAFFIAAEACADGLDVGERCTVSIVFSPGHRGASHASLDVEGGPSLALEGSTMHVCEPALAISASPTEFGGVLVGEYSRPLTLTIENVGDEATGPLETLITGSDSPQFEMGDDLCTGVSLAPGESCTASAVFAPIAPGEASATLIVTGVAALEGMLALRGTGIAPLAALTITPGVQNFGSVGVTCASADVTFTIESTGTIPASAVTVALSGPDSSEFRILGEDCGRTLAPGESCTAEIDFSPRTPGSKLAHLDAVGDSVRTSSDLSGTALTDGCGGRLIIEPSTRDFGMRAIGSRSSTSVFTARNVGGGSVGPVMVGLAGVSPGDFVLDGDTCSGATLPALGTCEVGVAFEPTAAGERMATLRFTTTMGAPATSALRGVGE